MNVDWLDAVVLEDKIVIITKRLVPTIHADGSFSVDPYKASVIGYHVTCKAHRTTVEANDYATACTYLEPESFCPRCASGEPADPIVVSDMTQRLRKMLLHQSLSQSVNNFIESLDVDV